MLVDVSTVAQALEVSPRRVQQLARQGWIPRESEGEYPLADSLTGYAAYKEEVAGRGGVGGAIDRARARKVKAQAELREVELAVESGEAVERSEAADRWGGSLAVVRAVLLQLPKVAPRVVHEEPAERERVLWDELSRATDVLGGGR